MQQKLLKAVDHQEPPLVRRTIKKRNGIVTVVFLLLRGHHLIRFFLCQYNMGIYSTIAIL